MKFFFRVCACKLFFFALQHSAGIFFSVDGVEKVGIPLLLLATLAAVLFNANRGSILAFVQFNSTAELREHLARIFFPAHCTCMNFFWHDGLVQEFFSYAYALAGYFFSKSPTLRS